VDDAFRDTLTVKVGERINEVEILGRGGSEGRKVSTKAPTYPDFAVIKCVCVRNDKGHPFFPLSPFMHSAFGL
jgi:hypothetical protein